MTTSRQELEQMALKAVDAEHYYALCDALEETPDEDLWAIVRGEESASG